MILIRGTTTPFKFKLPCANNELGWVTIHFSQTNNPSKSLPIIKKLEDCGPRGINNELDGSQNLYVSLTAEETTRFSDKYKARMQMRAQQIGGVTFGCKLKLITVYPMDDDIIEEDPTMPEEGVDGWIILDGKNII